MANGEKAEGQVSAVTGSNHLKRSRSKRLWFVGLLVLVVLIVIFALTKYLLTPTTADECNGTVSNSLVQQASVVLTPDDTPELAPVVVQIKKLSDYQANANCMYVVTLYYANKFDQTNAEASLSQFSKAYTGQTLYPALLKHASVAQLRTMVANVGVVLQQDEQRIIYIKSPPVPKKAATP